MEKPKNKKVKIVFFLLDGIADNQNPALGFKTPLQYANIPIIHSLA